MRIRKIEMQVESKEVVVDMRHASGRALQAVALIGGNQSGKSLAMELALRVFQSTAMRETSNAKPLFREAVNGMVEFEWASGVHVGLVRNGEIVQKPTTSNMTYLNKRLVGGCLFYPLAMRLQMLQDAKSGISSLAAATATALLQDVVAGDIRDCVVWVDDFDVGMDATNGRELFQQVLRACVSKDCQLIVSASTDTVFSSLGTSNVREIGVGKNVVSALRESICGVKR